MIPAEAFNTHTFQELRDGAAITRIMAAAIASADPGEAVRKTIQREGEYLLIRGKEYPLSSFQNLHFIGIGKASLAMADALVDILRENLDDGLVITKYARESLRIGDRIRVIQGGHPIPDENSARAGKEILGYLSGLGQADLLICLISGGGSALVSAPVMGIGLEEIQGLASSLLRCGARVDEINCLRRRLDRLKGGGMVRLAGGAAIVSLILSDVVGNPLEAIASGPTAPDPVSKNEVLSIYKKYRLGETNPESILHALESSRETPKPGDPVFDKVENILIGSNLLAIQAALKQAEEEGFHPYLLRADLQGEARQVGFELATFLRQAWKTGAPVPRPACILAGGETTVTLRGTGKGGRNTELALAAVTELADFPGVVLAALATDGEDGPTDAAGAVVTGSTYRRAMAMGLNPIAYLERNDSYSFFDQLGDLLKPSPTGTNVNDLTLLVTY